MRWLVALLAAAACGGGGIEYEGNAGHPQEVIFPGWVPETDMRVNGGPPQIVGLDTGAPALALDAEAYPGVPRGVSNADIDVLGLHFPAYPVATDDFFDSRESITALVGGDLFRYFGFSIDYFGGRAWLSDPYDTASRPGDLVVDPEILVPFDLIGGGRFSVGNDVITVPATRIVLPVTIETEQVWAMVDTGATSVVLDQELYVALGDTARRPVLQGIPVSTPSGIVSTIQTRVWRVTLGDAIVDDVPASMIPGSTLFASIASETGRDVRVLIGGHFLRTFFTTIDYPERALRFQRYQSPTHIDPNEWVDAGFQLDVVGEDWVVFAVFPDTDAAAQGLLENDVVERIGGMAIRGLSGAEVATLRAGYTLGTRMPLEIRRGTTILNVEVLVEDLLPHYPPP